MKIDLHSLIRNENASHLQFFSEFLHIVTQWTFEEVSS